ncbi:uncharacterized protein LOC131039695 isoform X2 [Cryptomeria japonica]|uniref:uncharacterized protein LOC131039695 isoform X2 n=1 Tax=Cryptomeria japonica TaxID=3369 RepID=UPI0025AC62E9|nr:uncharacterized protein LOC131039695 isoform X2 [Cryptomeria japonica]
MAMPLGATATWARATHIQTAFCFTLEPPLSRLKCLYSITSSGISSSLSIEQIPTSKKLNCYKRSLLNLIPNKRWKATDRQFQRAYCSWSAQESEDEPLASHEQVVVPPERWDVLGLGQAMVDFSGMVEDDFLEKLGLQKGIRKVVNHEERGKVLRGMDGCHYKAAAGGSLSNTLVALARLGMGLHEAPTINVAMTGTVGSDPLGEFYRAKLQRANVHFLSKPVKNGTTGTVIVLTTPDAQRTMLSYQGMSSLVNFDSSLSDLISKSRIFVVEGYLWEFPETIEAIAKACEAAHGKGVLVAITTSDVSCVTRHQKKFWDIIVNHADIVFANSDEAQALCGFCTSISPEMAARYLSHYSSLVSVTDGIRGSYIAVKGGSSSVSGSIAQFDSLRLASVEVAWLTITI